MKLKKTLSAFGLIAVTASGVLTGPAAASADAPEVAIADTAPSRLSGKFILTNTSGPAGYLSGGVTDSGFEPITYGNKLEDALWYAPTLTVPAVGTSGQIQIGDLCLPAPLSSPFALVSCDEPGNDGLSVDADGTIRNPQGRLLDITNGFFEWSWDAAGGPSYQERLLMSQLTPVRHPSASIGTPTLQQGASAQVTATFNDDASGQLIEIDHPAGTKITAVANSAFSLNSRGIHGALPSGTTSLTFTLTADQDAPIGSALGGRITYGETRTKLADFTATITVAPVAPAVTIESVTVQQGQSAGVDVEFNESVSGQVDIVLPAGLAPTGKAPSGFTWTPSIKGFRGTVTDANRAFTMDLTAAADAAVGTFDGVVRGSGLEQAWSATITAAPVAPAVTIESVTVQQGESVDVDIEFNESVSGQVDIVLPAGLAPTGKAPSGFTWMPGINGFRGTVTDANRAFTMDLTAAADAAVGTFDGVVRGGGVNEAWSATITAAPVAPAVTIGYIDVHQGESVSHPVSFNAAVSGEVEIVLPEGLKPTAGAPAGFVWDAGINGFRGTITDANRSFAMDLTAAADAAVGYHTGVVRGAGLNQVWSANIWESEPIPEEPLTLTSPAIGAELEPGAPVFSGTGQPDAKIQVYSASQEFLGETVVLSDGSWSLTWNTSLTPGRYAGGTVRQIVGDKPFTSVPYDFTVTSAEVAPLIVTSPKVGDTIEETTPVFTGTAQPGAKVEIRGASGGLLGSIDSVASNGKWSITWNKTVLPGRYVGGTVKQFVDGVERGKFVYDFTVELPDAAPLVVTSPKVGATIEETMPVFTGTAQPGAKVEIRGASGGLLGSVERVAANGAWSITWNKTVLPGRYVGGTVKQFVDGVERGTFTYDFTIGSTNIAPLLVTSPKVGDTTHETNPVFTGSAQPGAKVEIRGMSGAVLGSVESVSSNGQWSITWNKTVVPGRYSGGTVKQFVNGVERGKFVYDFTIVASQLVVTSPQLGETITGTRPVFTGTAIPNAEIQIRGAWGTDLGHTTANEHGEWTITWPTDYKPARYSGGTVTESVNGKVIGSFTYDFILAK